MYLSRAAGSLGRALRSSRPAASASVPILTRSTPRSLRPSSLALTTYKPFTTSLQRYQTSNTLDPKHEKEVAKEPLERHPDQVSSVSSVHQVFHERGVKETEDKGEDMLAGVKGDLVGANCAPSGRGQTITDGGCKRRERSRTLLPFRKYLEKLLSSVSRV